MKNISLIRIREEKKGGNRIVRITTENDIWKKKNRVIWIGCIFLAFIIKGRSS